MRMNLTNKMALIASLVLLTIPSLAGCNTASSGPNSAVSTNATASNNGADSLNGTTANSSSANQSTVTVTRNPITPTYSFNATVRTADTFTMNAPAAGQFQASVQEGDVLKAGDSVGSIGGIDLIVQTDSLVVSVAPQGLEYPTHYPLVTLSYPGYAFKVALPSTFASLVEESDLTAKFQPTDKEPADIADVYLSYESDENQEDSSYRSAQTVYALLLIPKDVDLHVGENALVVLRGAVRNDALTLPLSCLAGRSKQALVSVKNADGSFEQRTVTIGASDGSRIEIIDGLSEGDEVDAKAPNIDPRAS